MTIRSLASLIALVLSSACVQRTDLPIANDLLDLDRPMDQVVCHMKVLSARNSLSFHYGTYGATGSLANFRLIGDGFEVTIITPKERRYDLSAYDLAKGPETRARALKAYQSIKSGMLAPLPPACGR